MYKDNDFTIIPCKMIITNAQSKDAIIECLDSFLSSIKCNDNYSVNENAKTNTLSISFSNSKIAYDFLQEITYKKYNEDEFASLKAEIVFFQLSEYKRFQSEKDSIMSKETTSKKNKTIDIEKYISDKTPIRITAPYIDPQKKLFMEYKTGKSLWLNKKPFINSVNGRVLAIKEEFGTYVQRAPVNYAVVNYQHREVNKSKWLEKNGFKFKKALPDYIG